MLENSSRVGTRMGRGVPSLADLEVWGSVVSSPSGVRGGAQAAIALSACFRPLNASASKKNANSTLKKWW